MFIQILFEDPLFASWWLLVVVFSICSHEYGHALMAKLQGDTTAQEQGHLSLNPLQQMGITSLITLLLLGFAWGAVPVNPSRMRHKYSRLLVSLAGVTMNLLLFWLFVIAAVVCSIFWPGSEAIHLMGIGATLNALLFIFNSLPIPPLDGFTALTAAFPALGKRFNQATNKEVVAGMTLFLFLGMLVFGMRYIVGIAEFLTNFAMGLLMLILGVE